MTDWLTVRIPNYSMQSNKFLTQNDSQSDQNTVVLEQLELFLFLTITATLLLQKTK